MMWPPPAPMTRARSTNVRSFSDSVWRPDDPRGRRPAGDADDDDDHDQGHPDARRPRLSSPTRSRMIGARMRARTNVGRTRKKSVMRIRSVSIRPPTNPDAMPMTAPSSDRDDRRQQADDHRHPRAVDGQVEDVAAELVGAEDVAGRRWVEGQAGRGGDGLERPDEELRRDRDDREDEQHHDPEQPVAMARELAPEVALAAEPRPAADGRRRPGGPVEPGRRRRHVRTRGSRRP